MLLTGPLFTAPAELGVLGEHITEYLLIVSTQSEEVSLTNLSVVWEDGIAFLRRLLVVQFFHGGRVEPQVLHLLCRSCFSVIQVQCVQLEAAKVETVLVV